MDRLSTVNRKANVSVNEGVFSHNLTVGKRTGVRGCMYVVGSKSFRSDIQKPRQMENAVRDI